MEPNKIQTFFLTSTPDPAIIHQLLHGGCQMSNRFDPQPEHLGRAPRNGDPYSAAPSNGDPRNGDNGAPHSPDGAHLSPSNGDLPPVSQNVSECPALQNDRLPHLPPSDRHL